MAVIALVMMRSFMYEGSRPIAMFIFMLGLCIIMLDSFFDLVLFAAFFRDLSLVFPPFWNFLIMVAMYWENEK